MANRPDPALASEGIGMTGVCPNQQIEVMIERGEITASPEIIPAQVQPASLDLRLGTVAYVSLTGIQES